MSHITKINLIVKDLDAMSATAKRLGLELIRDQRSFVGYTAGTCDHVLRVKGAPANTYQIGLAKRADGKGYDLKWDGHMGQYPQALPLYNAVGYGEAISFNKAASCSKLLDWYAAEVTKKTMAKQGFRVTLSQQERKVQVVCSK
jgi:hypothetical protein